MCWDEDEFGGRLDISKSSLVALESRPWGVSDRPRSIEAMSDCSLLFSAFHLNVERSTRPRSCRMLERGDVAEHCQHAVMRQSRGQGVGAATAG